MTERFAEWFAFGWADLGAVVLTAVGVYAVVLAYTRWAGLRSFSKLSSFDFVVTVAVGSIVSSAIILKDVSLVRGAVALGVLFAIQETVGRLRLRYEFVARSIGNVPILLMRGSIVLHANLKRVRVSEDEMAHATMTLARIGLYTEPTCAQAAAAYLELLEAGVITPQQTTVVVLTSTGVKATPTVAPLVGVQL